MGARLMSTPVALVLFATSLAATLTASALFARRLDRLGMRLGIHEAVLGLLTALAADAPELSSGLTAMLRGEPGVGVGVLLGSNIFNLAAMVGVSALLAGSVRLERPALALEGAFALFATAVTGAVLFAGLAPGIALVVFAAGAAPYLVLLARGTFHGPLPPREPVTEGAPPPVDARSAARRVTQVVGLFVREIPALVAIVVGSIGMVYSAVLVAGRWGVPRPLVGLLLLATLTSLPNAYTAIRLGLAGRGAALVSEALNSNTINLSIGILVPAVIVSAARGGGGFGLDYLWMVAVTVATLALVGKRNGAGRLAGAAIVGSYVAYVAVRIATTA
jgi:cation:H+ antiporter